MKNIIAVVAAFFIISSCQKPVDLTLDPPPPPPPPGSGPARLTTVIELDTTRVAPLDTVTIVKFKYDAQGRNYEIERLFYRDESNIPFGRIVTGGKIVFSFNGNDTVPQRLLAFKHINPSVGTEWNDTVYFKWDASARLISDSMLTPDSRSPAPTPAVRERYVTHYSYAADSIRMQGYYFDYTGTTTFARAVYVKKIGGNVVEQRSATAPAVLDTTTIKVSYNAKPNPYSGTLLGLQYGQTPVFSFFIKPEDVVSVNAPVEIYERDAGSTPAITQIFYQYDSLGRTAVAKYFALDDPTYFQTKILFRYGN